MLTSRLGPHTQNTGYADCLLARSGRCILISLADSQHNLYDITIAVYTVLRLLMMDSKPVRNM
jgi:hypothetical protein